MSDSPKPQASFYSREHAQAFHSLLDLAYGDISSGERPQQTSPDLLDHYHSAANPAGRALVVTAHEAGRCIGSVSGIPSRFCTRDGRSTVGYQVSFFMVAPNVQRRGLGLQLLETLIDTAAEQPGGFAWGYPNPRAIGAARKVGFDILDTIPTLIYAPRSATTTLRDREGRRWEVRSADAEEATRAVGELSLPHTGFFRDADYFRWRYRGPHGERYRFVICHSASDGFVVVLGRHVWRRMGFTILVELLSTDPSQHWPLAVQAARSCVRQLGTRLAFAISNVPRGAALRLPRALLVPDNWSPRSVKLVLHPRGGAVAADEITHSTVMTGDWLAW